MAKTENAKVIPVDVKGGSTTILFVGMASSQYQLSKETPRDVVALIAITENGSAGIKSDVRNPRGYAELINKTLNDLGQLEHSTRTNPTALQMYNSLMGRTKPIEAEIREKQTELEQNTKDVSEFIRHQHQAIQQIVTAVADGSKTKVKAIAELLELMKEQKVLTEKYDKFKINEMGLTDRLTVLSAEVRNTTDAIVGVQYRGPTPGQSLQME